jgi:hypothetical protein
MKYVIALLAALALSAPVFAQEVETLPDGRKVRIEKKDGAVIIEEVEEGEAEKVEEEDSGSDEFEKIHKILGEDDIQKRIEDILKRIGEKSEEAEEGLEESELPEEVQDILKRFREQMEEMRKDMEEHLKKAREEMEKHGESHTGPDGEEVEEYEHKSADGKTHGKIKIVRIRKSSSEGESPEAPEQPKKESERKQ